MTLIYVVLGWICGIAVVTQFPRVSALYPVLILAGLVMTVLTRGTVKRQWLSLAVVAAGFGMWRFVSAQPTNTPDNLLYYNDKGYAEIQGIVVDAPELQDTALRLRVEVQSIQRANKTYEVHGLALVRAPRFMDIQYGDKVLIQGEPTTAPYFETVEYSDEDHPYHVTQLSYKDYLARSGVYSFIPFSKISVIEHSQGQPFYATLLDIRNRSQQLINQLLPSPQSALLAGILVGNDNDIPQDIKDAFNRTGTSHIVAISGFNITIVAGFLFSVLGRFLNRRNATILTLLGLVLYTIFVGANPSVVRAAIMGSLAIMAERFGRRGNGLTALAISVWVMTLINPNVLFDMGLVLSASATLGLILYAQPLTDLTEKLFEQFFAKETAHRLTAVISDAVLLTMAAQITTLPIIFLVFGRFSVVSFLVNALVLPVQAPIMGLGVLAIVIGAIWLPAGQVLAWLVGLPLAYTLAVIRAIAQWPGAAVAVNPDPGVIGFYYLILFGATAVLSQPTDQRKTLLERIKARATIPLVSVLGVAIAAIVWAIVASRPDGKLHIWYLNVGEGSATLIQTPQGAHILIDGGENSSRLRTALGDKMPFYKRDIDLLIVTQPHNKSITALPPLFERYNVQSAIINGQSDDSDAYKALFKAFTDHNTKVVTALAGYTATTNDGVVVEILNPAQMPTTEMKPNDAPLLIRIGFGQASFILTPEISEKGMKAFVKAGRIPHASVIELAANGAEKENPPEWIGAVAPQVVIISAEVANKSAQPDENVIKLLSDKQVFRTDRDGTIEIATNGDQLFVRTEKGN